MSLALIVDDEPDIRELLAITLTRMGVTTACAEDLACARQTLAGRRFDLVLTDMHLPDGSGLELIADIQRDWPQTPVAVITAYGSMETAITALKAGAYDFICKPIDLARLRELVSAALSLAQCPPVEDADDPLLGSSEAMQSLRRTLHKLARSQAPVFIHGESGSGKELVAHRIHDLGTRADQPFIPVNCGAIPIELMETEFFGHKKGSFTGAQEDKIGLFQAAAGGTLFLDEVADLPLSMQVKLLRAIQEKSVRPVGATREIAIDVRIISATHKDLTAEVEAGRFRQDLFYRLHVIPLRVPALRERREDIALLSDAFLTRMAEDWGIATPRLHAQARQRLQNYLFPGNVRELQNILERAVTLSDGQLILAEHLQIESPSPAPPPSPAQDLPAGAALEEYLQDIERRAILQALEETRWNRTLAAKKLGMIFRSLRYRLKKMGLDQDDGDDAGSGQA